MNEEQTVIHKRVPMGGAPRERNASLLVLSGRALGQLFKIMPGEMVLGRSTEADIRLDDEGVSRQHAKIRRRSDGTVEVSDLDSTNGTYVNGAQIRHFTLSDGDRIQIGFGRRFVQQGGFYGTIYRATVIVCRDYYTDLHPRILTRSHLPEAPPPSATTPVAYQSGKDVASSAARPGAFASEIR